MSYEFTADMIEISGFGGSYEEACRAMVSAGLKWLDEHAEVDPKFSEYENIYGIINEDNDEAKMLSSAMVAAVADKGGATGAMHQACVSHVLLIRRIGWEKYCEESRARAKAEEFTEGN